MTDFYIYVTKNKGYYPEIVAIEAERGGVAKWSCLIGDSLGRVRYYGDTLAQVIVSIKTQKPDWIITTKGQRQA